MNTDPQYRTGREYRQAQLSRTAFLFSVIALFSCFISIIPLLPYFAGVGAILAAILSRGRDRQYSRQARLGLILGSVAITVYTAIMVAAFFTFFNGIKDPATRQQISDILYQQTGMTLDDLMRYYSF